MVVSDAAIHNIMGGIENTGDVRLHNHRRKLKQRFDIVRKLGQGTYGKVQLGINKETGQEVAIKTIRKCKIETEADLIRIRREIQIMSSVRHPNIIHIYEVFENREKMVLVMEYAAGGELYDYLSERKVLAEEEARRIFRQIATAVYYCHKHNICHRDLKLENILLDEVGNAKIADFGLSNVFSYSTLLSTFCGSPLYASPEIVKGTPYHGPEVDCWSLGVLLYTLVYGAMPFDGSNFKRLVKQISQGDYFEPKNPSPASPLIADMLNVNPARRADISAICSHWWINETYKEICLDIAEELASQTPVRLDLLLSLTAPAVNTEKIVVGVEPVTGTDDVNGKLDRPVRSQSLGNIPPAAVAPTVAPFQLPETKEAAAKPMTEDKKPKLKKKDRSHSKSRRKERSRSRPRRTDGRESADRGTARGEGEANGDVIKSGNVLVNSGTQIICKNTEKSTPELHAVQNQQANVEKDKTKSEEEKLKPVERRKSKVFEVAEKFNVTNEKPTTKVAVPSKKIILPSSNVEDTRKEFERRLSQTSGSSSPPKKSSTVTPTSPDEPFPLASTVALNKLVESAFRDEPTFDINSTSQTEVETKFASKIANVGVVEGNSNKAATLPRRRTSRAEIQLVTPQFLPDNYKTEVEHFVNKPVVNHKTEVLIPVSAPLLPNTEKSEPLRKFISTRRPLMKAENQSKEHIIPIQLEQEPQRKVSSLPASGATSKSSILRTSSSSLSRQSTVDSDSGSTISTGEPIRKSPREVIIPIAVEGGGFVTPSSDTLTRMSSVNDSEDESTKGSRCFTLRSTKKRQPEQSQTVQLDTADSLSSDEDDNFQLLTAENLFSTLLSRVRSLTQRLNNDDMRRTSAFPRSLFAHHSSLFDNVPSRRLTETRSFNRPENAPWRRSMSSSSSSTPKRDDSIKKRYSCISEETPCTKSNAAESKPQNSPAAAAETASTLSKLGETTLAKKYTIEEEFDKFFSKYRSKPTGSVARALDYASKQQSLTTATNAGRRGKTVETKEDIWTSTTQQDEKKVKARPPRKSRFLRPDFYDTPREESKYVIKNEVVRAFRERSLSRQRELSRNRSAESFSNGLTGTDYVRSKTCSLTDRTEGSSTGPRDCGRTTSENAAKPRNDFEKSLRATKRGSLLLGSGTSLTRSGSRNEIEGNDTLKRNGVVLPRNSTFDLSIPSASIRNDSELEEFNKSKRKSLILQNELENTIRRTQNMNSKLSGLMVALNDTESQYEKTLGKLYGCKPEKTAEKPATNGEVDHASRTDLAATDPPEGRKLSSRAESAAEPEKNHRKLSLKTEPLVEPETNRKLSLLEKKYAYFRKLQSKDENKETAAPEEAAEKTDPSKESMNAALSTESNRGRLENDTGSLTSPPPEDADSDAWSVLSDNADSQYLDNVNDRIRRRSFYSRFNLSTQKSSSNIAGTTKPSTSYSRSSSADYRHRSSSNGSRPE